MKMKQHRYITRTTSSTSLKYTLVEVKEDKKY
jgi:hypothetical protein